MKRYLLVFAVCFLAGGCSYQNLDEVKKQAPAVWEQAGYRVVGYEGYQWGVGFGKYGGAMVWHTLTRDAAPTVIYTGSIQRWGEEFHIYGPKAVDAIKP